MLNLPNKNIYLEAIMSLLTWKRCSCI